VINDYKDLLNKENNVLLLHH